MIGLLTAVGIAYTLVFWQLFRDNANCDTESLDVYLMAVPIIVMLLLPFVVVVEMVIK